MGEGDPLVLIHGLMDSHRTWRRAAPLLARRFRLLMPDLPGHGLSGRPDAPYTLSWHSQMLADWMKSLGVEKTHICGHSFGAGIAQWMILEQRARVNRLALVSAGGLGRGVAPGMRFASFPVLGRMLTPLALRHIMPIVLKLSPKTFGHMEPEEIERFVAMQDIPGTERAFQRSLEGVINFFGQHMQTSQRSDEIDDMPPIALFWGDKDPIIPIRHGRTAVSRSDGITLTTYKGCGHFPQLDVSEDFARDLTEFLCDPNRFPALIHRAS
jgi:pimeloyl-ACP methyl ester carboxylesterase